MTAGLDAVSILDVVLFNVAVSAGLGLLAWWVSRRLHRPALAHTLWILVLLKLVTPPVLELEGIPRIASHFARPSPNTALQEEPLVPVESRDAAVLADDGAPPRAGSLPSWMTASSRAPSGAASHGTWTSGLVSAWPERAAAAGMLVLWALLAGTLWVVGLTLVRAWRFQRRLQREPEAPEHLQARASEIGRLLGVSRLPRIRLVSQRISPSLWPRLGSCEILLPARLLPRLTADERDMLIAHELAHVQRRDHWVRPLEQLVVALYWWNPVAWWARRHLRVEEEKSCDAFVLERLPGRARSYAEGLLKSIEFLAMKPRMAPALATGAGTAIRLEERMKAILDTTGRKRDSRRLRALFVLPAIVTLLAAPAWVSNSAGVDEPKENTKENSQSMKMHREELQLQKELREIETQHMQVQMQIEAARQEQERLHMRQELAKLEQEGRQEEAAELRRQLARAEREAAFQHQQMQQELRFTQKREALEFELEELALQREELLQQGDEAKAKALLERAQEIELQLRRLQLENLRNDLERSRQLLDFSKQELESLSKP